MPGKKKGLYANIHAKRKRIKAGSKETMRKPGTKEIIMPSGKGTYGSKKGRPPKKKKTKTKKK